MKAQIAGEAEGKKIKQEKKQKREQDKIFAVFRKLYPRIPEEMMESIYEYSWEKGSKRVGTLSELSDEEKVRLATASMVRRNKHKVVFVDSLTSD